MEEKAEQATPAQSSSSTPLVVIAQFRRQLAGLMRIDEHEVIKSPDEIIAFRGQVEGDVDAAFEQMSQRFGDQGYTISLRDLPGGGHEVVAIKGKFEREPGRIWVNVVLFLATLVSVLYVGALQELDPSAISDIEGSSVLLMPLAILYKGIPFAATLMGILLAHELSHYFVGRRRGSPFSLPYFIPLPVPPFGTMGAVIVQRSMMRNRRIAFDAGIAGPLGGLIVAIPLLILGLSLSKVGPIPPDVEAVWQEGNSLLYLGIKYLLFGRILPSDGVDVWLHPVAFAAWGGLFITMLNLLPIGQLDGGHISYALLGRRAWKLGYMVIAAMIAWGGWLLVTGNGAGGSWLVWAFLNMTFNPRHPPPLNDATKLDGRRIALGVLMLVILILTFMPVPLRQIVLQ